MTDKKLERATEAFAKAEAAMREQMRRVYPPGTRLGVRLMAGQMHPSFCTVIDNQFAHQPDADGGTIRVKMDHFKSWRSAHRDIHVNNIMEKLS